MQAFGATKQNTELLLIIFPGKPFVAFKALKWNKRIKDHRCMISGKFKILTMFLVQTIRLQNFSAFCACGIAETDLNWKISGEKNVSSGRLLTPVDVFLQSVHMKWGL